MVSDKPVRDDSSEQVTRPRVVIFLNLEGASLEELLEAKNQVEADVQQARDLIYAKIDKALADAGRPSVFGSVY